MNKSWLEIRPLLQAVLVGGAVRDSILGIEPKDRDYLVLNKTEDEMLALGFERVGKTVSAPVFLHPLDPNKEEYALPRIEISTGCSTSEFKFKTDGITLEEDLLRRDLTINAMAIDDDGNVTDPFGGQKDLAEGIIRHVSNAFSEDPLRIFRAARFAAKFNFKVANETIELCRSMVLNGLHKTVPTERVQLETKKALKTSKPSKYFECLRDFGALEYWFEELHKMIGIPQPESHHQEGDVFNHTMMVLDQARLRTDDTAVLFAALVHDMGKIETPCEILPRHFKHEKRGKELIDKFTRRLNIGGKNSALMKLMCELHMNFNRVTALKSSTLIKIFNRLAARHHDYLVEAWCVIGESDAMGRIPSDSINEVEERTAFVMSALSAFRSVKANPNVKDVGADLIMRQVDALNKVRANCK